MVMRFLDVNHVNLANEAIAKSSKCYPKKAGQRYV